jgi:ribonucleoside-diphosphate reductase alpha chain
VEHNSNLCTEITLNNSADETAVCNLGSLNLRLMVNEQGVLTRRIKESLKTAVRLLDNVIDLNYYPTEEAKNSNLKHRPIGLGMMGLQDALYIQRIPFDSPQALDFTDSITEVISYYTLQTSSDLAAQRGAYGSFKGLNGIVEYFPWIPWTCWSSSVVYKSLLIEVPRWIGTA